MVKLQQITITMNIQGISDILQKKYDGLLKLSEEKAFFINLADYVDYIYNTQTLERTITNLKEKLSVSGQSAQRLNEVHSKNPIPSKEEHEAFIETYKNATDSQQKEMAEKTFQELKKLLTQERESNNFISTHEASVGNAYFKLLHLRNLILDRQRLEEAIKQSPNGYAYNNFILESKELDRILLTSEQKLNRLDLVETNSKTGELIENPHRDYFIRKDYLSYLSLLHNYILTNLDKMQPGKINTTFPLELISSIEEKTHKDKRLQTALKIVKELVKTGKSDNYLLAKRLKGKSSLSKTRYYENIKSKSEKRPNNNYNDQLRNIFRTIKSFWEPLGYSVSYSKKDNSSEIVRLEN